MSANFFSLLKANTYYDQAENFTSGVFPYCQEQMSQLRNHVQFLDFLYGVGNNFKWNWQFHLPKSSAALTISWHNRRNSGFEDCLWALLLAFVGICLFIISEWAPLFDGQFFYNGHLWEYVLHLFTKSWYRIIIIRYFKEIIFTKLSLGYAILWTSLIL